MNTAKKNTNLNFHISITNDVLKTLDYRSSRASFSVKRGDYVYILKQVGRACYLVRKQTNGQIGFIPKALIAPTTSTQVDTFLKMHEYRETII
ncbi:unnamed protein product [Adineta steineri]|uniref:SH3 domain-containing protein n=1 Tax=Adineta steineri TaxID=433720 RepID=A0A814BV72_9BILA|nr:unnamed protein product [Adineta steineri]